MPPDALLGPTAALVGAVAIIVALWRSHVASDTDVRSQRDIAIAGWRDQTNATDRLAAVIETNAARKRQQDER